MEEGSVGNDNNDDDDGNEMNEDRDSKKEEQEEEEELGDNNGGNPDYFDEDDTYESKVPVSAISSSDSSYATNVVLEETSSMVTGVHEHRVSVILNTNKWTIAMHIPYQNLM